MQFFKTYLGNKKFVYDSLRDLSNEPDLFELTLDVIIDINSAGLLEETLEQILQELLNGKDIEQVINSYLAANAEAKSQANNYILNFFKNRIQKLLEELEKTEAINKADSKMLSSLKKQMENLLEEINLELKK